MDHPDFIPCTFFFVIAIMVCGLLIDRKNKSEYNKIQTSQDSTPKTKLREDGSEDFKSGCAMAIVYYFKSGCAMAIVYTIIVILGFAIPLIFVSSIYPGNANLFLLMLWIYVVCFVLWFTIRTL
jgi:hypothetical protein